MKLKVTDKHNQLWQQPIPHTRHITLSPSCGFTPAAKVAVRGLESLKPEGVAPPLSPTQLHWQQQVWWPADMQLPGWESALCDRDNGRSEGKSDLEGERSEEGGRGERRGGRKEDTDYRKSLEGRQREIFSVRSFHRKSLASRAKNRSKTNTYSNYDTPVVLQ